MTATEPVIVIGAGASGLAAADALAQHGLPVLMLEQEARLAEPWRRRHERLSLNTHRVFSSLPGLAYPPGTAAFPTKENVVTYLERFAAERGLAIEFGAAVERDRKSTRLNSSHS